MSIFQLLLDFIKNSDFLGILILSVFLISFIIALLKLFTLRSFLSLDRDSFSSGIFNNLERGNIFECINHTDDLGANPLSKIIKVGILHSSQSIKRVESAINNESLRQKDHLESFMGILWLCIFLIASFGCLGALIEMSKCFFELNNSPTNITIGSVSYFIGRSLLYAILSLVASITLYILYHLNLKLLRKNLLNLELGRNDYISFLQKKSIDIEKIKEFTQEYDF